MQAPAMLQAATAANLEKSLEKLIEEGDLLDITDPSLPSIAINVKVKWEN